MSNLAYQTEPKHKIDRKVSRQPKQVKKPLITPGEQVLVFILLVFLAVGSYFIVANQATLYQVNNEVQSLQEKIENQKKVNISLSEQVAELKNPERILSIAKEQGLTVNENNLKLIK